MASIRSKIAVLAFALVTAATAFAQSYPSKAVRIIVPFPAGGGVDSVARTVAQKLSENIGQPVIIDNRGGAGGSIGTEAVARSAPDGYTLLFTTHGHTIQPSLQKVPWDPVRDFSPVIQVLTFSFLITVHPSVPANSLKELIDYAKVNPGKLSYGSSGTGGPIHFAVEMFKSMAGVDIIHVPYKGNGPLTTALITGEVQMSMDAMGVSLPQMRAGKLRGLAVSGPKRWPPLPDMPTIAEAAIPGFDHLGWHGIVAPTGTPKETVAYLNRELVKVLSSREVRERIMGLGYDPTTTTVDEFADIIKRDQARYLKVIKESGIRAE